MLTYYNDTFALIDRGDIDADGVRNAYQYIVDNYEALVDAIAGSYTVAELRSLVIAPYAKRKADLVDAYARALLDRFAMLNGEPFSVMVKLSAGVDMNQVRHQARLDALAKLTDEMLRERAGRIRLDADRRETALSDPQTLDDFITYLRAHAAAPLEALDDDQLERFDRLMYERARADCDENSPQSGVTTTSEGRPNVPSMTITEGWHTRDNVPIWTVKPAERLPRELFKDLSTRARGLRGGYSRYSGGWNFKNRENAFRFAGIDPNAGKPEPAGVDAKPEAVRLRKWGHGLIERATAKMEAPRQVNTARRARIASGIEAEARLDMRIGHTAVLVADAIEAGQAGPLAAIRDGAGLKAIVSIMRSAHFSAVRDEGHNFAGSAMRPIRVTDARFAQFPKATIDLYDARALASEKIRGVRSEKAWLRSAIREAEADRRGYINGGGELAILMKRSKNAKALAGGRLPYERMRRMGIDNVSVLRHFIRALIPLWLQAGDMVSGVDPIKRAERELVGVKIPGFFKTPTSVAARMASMIDPKPMEVGCEPSAGTGRLIDAILDYEPDAFIEYFEINTRLADILRMKYKDVHNVNQAGHDQADMERMYHWIIMNPPFENRQDVEHVKHAYEHLHEGGRLVAIVSAGSVSEGDRFGFSEWLESNGGYVVEMLEAGTFREAGTNVRSTIVYLEK